MFREMRRKDKLRSKEDCEKMLREVSDGVFSVIGDEGYPYGVPVNHVYVNGVIYFHSAEEGHKIDAVKANPKASYLVVGANDVDPIKRTTIYKSVICFGKARLVDTWEEKLVALNAVAQKYCQGYMEGAIEEIKEVGPRTAIIAIDIEHMTGKGLAE